MSLVWIIVRVTKIVVDFSVFLRFVNFQIFILWSIFYQKIPNVERILQSCSSKQSKIVRDVVSYKWLTILKKYQRDLPFECPFHPQRDIYKTKQDAKKEYKPNQWYCELCGKTFFTEDHIDTHFDVRHHKVMILVSITLTNHMFRMRISFSQLLFKY